MTDPKMASTEEIANYLDSCKSDNPYSANTFQYFNWIAYKIKEKFIDTELQRADTLQKILSNPEKWMQWCDIKVLERTEEAEKELKVFREGNIIEVMIRNPQVFEYARHWENRTLTAEAKITDLEKYINDWKGDPDIRSQLELLGSTNSIQNAHVKDLEVRIESLMLHSGTSIVELQEKLEEARKENQAITQTSAKSIGELHTEISSLRKEKETIRKMREALEGIANHEPGIGLFGYSQSLSAVKVTAKEALALSTEVGDPEH